MSNLLLAPAIGTGLQGRLTPYVFESSSVEDLQTRLQALLDDLIDGTITGNILDLAIAGSGDGHTFAVTALVDENGVPPRAGSVIIFYMAASSAELPVAMNAAVAQLTDGDAITLHGVHGAAQGRRWMGFISTIG